MNERILILDLWKAEMIVDCCMYEMLSEKAGLAEGNAEDD